MVNRQESCLLLYSALLAAVIACCLLLADYRPAADAVDKQKAAALAASAQSVLTGHLPGPEYTLLTTTLGSKEAKQLSLHPDFAAVTVDLLQKAGIKAGDRVAVNFSGSFPGLNIAVLAALHTVGCEPAIVSSVGASTWGATDPQITWLDMENALAQAGLWTYRSLAASPGGVGDTGGGLTKEGIDLIHAALSRNHIPALGSSGVADGVARRLMLYRDADGRLPAALINVGGNHVIFGKSGHGTPLKQGLHFGHNSAPPPPGSLAEFFLAADRPVIHFININRLAAKYRIDPSSQPFSSQIYMTRSLSPQLRLLALSSLAAIFAILWNKRRKGHWQLPKRKLTGS